MTIRANPNLLDQVGRDVLNLGNEVRDATSLTQQAGNNALHAWNSQFSFQFLSSVEAVTRRLRDLEMQIMVAGKKLQIAANEVREAERRLQAQMAAR